MFSWQKYAYETVCSNQNRVSWDEIVLICSSWGRVLRPGLGSHALSLQLRPDLSSQGQKKPAAEEHQVSYLFTFLSNLLG